MASTLSGGRLVLAGLNVAVADHPLMMWRSHPDNGSHSDHYAKPNNPFRQGVPPS
jgi:hypothetical protein